jgi:AcrR family transcriptional regulator
MAPLRTGEVHNTAVDGSTRERILTSAMSLMSERGVEGTSMRELATAVGLNVASLYHYFPSKKDLLDAVIGELGEFSARTRMPTAPRNQSADLVQLLTDMLASMIEVEDFVRLMMGETIQGGETARAAGLDLCATFQAALTDWLVAHRPNELEGSLASECTRLLYAVLVGTFYEYLAGLLDTRGEDVAEVMRRRAEETVRVLNLGGWSGSVPRQGR